GARPGRSGGSASGGSRRRGGGRRARSCDPASRSFDLRSLVRAGELLLGHVLEAGRAPVLVEAEAVEVEALLHVEALALGLERPDFPAEVALLGVVGGLLDARELDEDPDDLAVPGRGGDDLLREELLGRGHGLLDLL